MFADIRNRNSSINAGNNRRGNFCKLEAGGERLADNSQLLKILAPHFPFLALFLGSVKSALQRRRIYICMATFRSDSRFRTPLNHSFRIPPSFLLFFIPSTGSLRTKSDFRRGRLKFVFRLVCSSCFSLFRRTEYVLLISVFHRAANFIHFMQGVAVYFEAEKFHSDRINMGCVSEWLP